MFQSSWEQMVLISCYSAEIYIVSPYSALGPSLSVSHGHKKYSWFQILSRKSGLNQKGSLHLVHVNVFIAVWSHLKSSFRVELTAPIVKRQWVF